MTHATLEARARMEESARSGPDHPTIQLLEKAAANATERALVHLEYYETHRDQTCLDEAVKSLGHAVRMRAGARRVRALTQQGAR